MKSGVLGLPHCPPEGLAHFPDEKYCDRYFLCKNGTLTEEVCPNGLLYQEHGAVFDFCAHNWNVDCHGKEARKLSLVNCNSY